VCVQVTVDDQWREVDLYNSAISMQAWEDDDDDGDDYSDGDGDGEMLL
jgi:hypothetical protein